MDLQAWDHRECSSDSHFYGLGLHPQINTSSWLAVLSLDQVAINGWHATVAMNLGPNAQDDCWVIAKKSIQEQCPARRQQVEGDCEDYPRFFLFFSGLIALLQVNMAIWQVLAEGMSCVHFQNCPIQFFLMLPVIPFPLLMTYTDILHVILIDTTWK